MHSNVTIKNVSWPHFSWPTLYVQVCAYQSQCPVETYYREQRRSDAYLFPVRSGESCCLTT